MTTVGVPASTLTRAVALAVLAPSLHNAQPWRFRLLDDGIEVRTDPLRLLPIADPTGRAARLACGTAVFNLRLAYPALLGRVAEVSLLPDPADPALLARVTAGPPHRSTRVESALYDAIPHRRGNRGPFLDTPVPPAHLPRLLDAARAEGLWLTVVDTPAAVVAVAELIRTADATLTMELGYQAELLSWMDRDRASGDGAAATVAIPRDLPRDLPRDPSPPGRELTSEPVVAVLESDGDLRRDQLIAGQALQRVLLTAVALGLSVSILSQPIEVPAMREQLRTLLGRVGMPQVVLRIGYCAPQPKTPRRPVHEVIAP